MSNTDAPGDGGQGGSFPVLGNLSGNPAYLAAWERATSGPTHAARQSAVADMEIIASGGSPAGTVPAPAPLTLPASAAPVGVYREAAARTAAASGTYQEAFAVAADPRAPAAARDAAISRMESLAQADQAAQDAAPAPDAPAIPEGYEPAASLAEYRDPSSEISNRKALAQTKADMHEAGVPAFIGTLALSEAAANAHLLADQASFDGGIAKAASAIVKAHGAEAGQAMLRDADLFVASLPEKLRYDGGLLRVSPQAVVQMAQMHRLGILRGK